MNDVKHKGYREELGLGLKAIYESGFTQGTVGVGVDVFGLQGIKLDSGGGRHGNNLFPTDGRSGKAQDNYSQAGAAIKARLSNTTLKYGEQFVDLPVFSTDDSRLLPESATGFLVTSEEIDGLVVHAGHFTAMTAMDATRRDSANGGELRSLDLIGARYNFTDNLSAAYYYSKAKLGGKNYVNAWDENVRDKVTKQYVNVNYVYPIADNQSVTVDFNAYKTRLHDRNIDRDDRDRLTKNDLRSLAISYNLGAHTFTIGKQCVEGNDGYIGDYDGGGTMYFLNDMQYNSFSQQGEKSYHISYNLNMDTLGVPGLDLTAAYVRGSNIRSTHWDAVNNVVYERNQGKNWEANYGAKYVVQSGAAKDLSLHLRNATYRANDAAGNPDVNEVRFIVEYPLSIL